MKAILLSVLGCAVIAVISCKPADSNNANISGNKPRTEAITKSEAIKIAEEFVASQGYTSDVSMIDKHKIVFEPGEYATDTAALLKMRYNMIKPTAFGARNYKKKTAWCVGFELTVNDENKGKWVGMDTLGNQLVMNKDLMRLDWLLEAKDGELYKEEIDSTVHQ